ncbi:MAG: hypothetical protein HEQ20_13225 [Aphanizomenon flos-aquae KM1D3_PB]|uniref:UPF0175 family protein n=1 Tax=Aphanizomenon flos-aquae TaxID=1176 RepID=UPI0005443175|nr:UPF0175 family protein [Aphanizomenon flos-aquae]KHG41616.1 hypothetical protein OA07_10050 [Aphanizomenon flos-aquae 2012/KM1/D3]KHG42984.1 hypothetical protein OA07_01565 [Aphanizomenon flos-aquae 2012/KM1/D3]QSV71536.1 MAG: hypothetical protein HEQ20_13225 [Aphanizomenon flos-aquae KM1D3_PB]
MSLVILDEQLESIQLSDEVRKKALQKAKEGYVMTLLEVGEISSGRAGKILAISRLEVIEMMKRWGISLFDDSQTLEELCQEVEQAELILNQQIS